MPFPFVLGAYAAEGGGAADATPPVVSSVSPVPGTVGPDDAVTFRVTDETEVKSVIVWAELAGEEAPEVVFTGTRFTKPYAQDSTRTAVSGGWDFEVFRKGGWPSDFLLEVRVADAGGNDAVYEE